MGEEWIIEGPRVIDVGGDGERVRELSVAVVGGHVDVVTHNDSPTARVEVTSIKGRPLKVEWDGAKLKVNHGIDAKRILDRLRGALDTLDRNRVTLSISIPEEARTTVSSVSASSLLAGMRSGANAHTVSGTMTLDDITGSVDINTVSGEVECLDLAGDLTVNTVSGAVTAQHSTLSSVSVNTVSGDVTLDLENDRSKISSNSVSGDVTVRTRHDGYDVRGASATGQVVVAGQSVSKQQQRRGERVRAGDGGVHLDANAVSGNVVLLQAQPGEAATDAGAQDR